MYLDNYIDQIKALCTENKVRRLFVFGSVLTDQFNESSDVDFVGGHCQIRSVRLRRKLLRFEI